VTAGVTDFKPKESVTMKVVKLIGGAGTGKTTELKQSMERMLPHLGGDPTAIGFASFTRAARGEMVARVAEAFGCPEETLSGNGGWFRTVHSTCIKMLKVSSDNLLTDSDASMKWIAGKLGATVKRKMIEGSGFSTVVNDDEATQSLSVWDVSRSRMETLLEAHTRLSRCGETIPSWAVVKHYVKLYEHAKKQEGKSDFVDVVARYGGVRFTMDGPEEVEPEGGLPPVKAWVFDEAQDSSALVDRVCRRLASGDDVKWTLIAADPFQSIFAFGGADYRHFMGWEADEVRTMPQSYRCPRPIMELGERCLKRMKNGYFDRGIAPAGHEGTIRRGCSIEQAISKIDINRTTLILARCGFSLERFRDILNQRRIPHASVASKSDSTSMAAYNCLWRIQHGQPVGGSEWKAAAEYLPVKNHLKEPLLRHGFKAKWLDGRMDEACDFLRPDDIESIGGATTFLMDIVKKGEWGSLVDGGMKWLDAAKKHGPEMATSPKVRLSTIHGAKGMEADDVILCTNTSRRTEEAQENSPEAYDEECRIEYVAVTRARQNLVICESDEPFSMELPK